MSQRPQSIKKGVRFAEQLVEYEKEPACAPRFRVPERSLSCHKKLKSILRHRKLKGVCSHRILNWYDLEIEGKCGERELKDMQHDFHTKVRFLNKHQCKLLKDEKKLISHNNKIGMTNAKLKRLENKVEKFDAKLEKLEKRVAIIKSLQSGDDTSPPCNYDCIPDLVLKVEHQMLGIIEQTAALAEERKKCMPSKSEDTKERKKCMSHKSKDTKKRHQKMTTMQQVFAIQECHLRTLLQAENDINKLMDETVAIENALENLQGEKEEKTRWFPMVVD